MHVLDVRVDRASIPAGRDASVVGEDGACPRVEVHADRGDRAPQQPAAGHHLHRRPSPGDRHAQLERVAAAPLGHDEADLQWAGHHAADPELHVVLDVLVQRVRRVVASRLRDDEGVGLRVEATMDGGPALSVRDTATGVVERRDARDAPGVVDVAAVDRGAAVWNGRHPRRRMGAADEDEERERGRSHVGRVSP